MDATVVEIDQAECRRRLAGASIGRVITTLGALPAAFPVPYRLSRDQVVFWTGHGVRFDPDAASSVLGFQIDEIDPRHLRGWSVLAIGLASEVLDPIWRAEITRSGLLPWASAADGSLIALDPTLLTGRLIS